MKILTVVSLACVTAFAFSAQAVKETDAQKLALAKANGAQLEKQHVMPKTEYVQMRQIAIQTDDTGTISDKDIDYLSGILRTTDKSSTAPGFIHLCAVADFTVIRTFGTGQKQKIMDVVTPLFSSKVPLDQRAAVAVAEALKDKWAIPYVLPLVNSPNQVLSKHAQAYLQLVGYQPKA
ncbi:MAG TPA: hypothetical protein VGL56_13505 [Fimbriimonadaceae bacterium]